MALVFAGHSQCPICSNVIGAGEAIVATPAFLEDKKSPLWRFNDAAMHQSCFDRWEMREAFIVTYNNYYAAHYRGMRQMLDDGSIVECEPQIR